MYRRGRVCSRSCTLLIPVACIASAITGETGLVRALATMFERVSNGISQKQIEELIALGPPAVIRILARLANILRVPALPGEPPARPPTLVLSIDQGEELFGAEGRGESRPLLHLLAGLMTRGDITVLVTIRTDAYLRHLGWRRPRH